MKRCTVRLSSLKYRENLSITKEAEKTLIEIQQYAVNLSAEIVCRGQHLSDQKNC